MCKVCRYIWQFGGAREVVGVMARLLEVREEQLDKEILPVGNHTGPEPGPEPAVMSVVLAK